MGYDISLPRGDSFGVSGSLVAAGFVLFGDTAAIVFPIVGISALLAAHLLRKHWRIGRSTVFALAVRGTDVGMATPRDVFQKGVFAPRPPKALPLLFAADENA